MKHSSTPLWIFCDGGAGDIFELNAHAGASLPAALQPAGCAAVARNDQGTIVEWAWQALVPMSNNEAEYAGLLLGMELAHRLRIAQVIFLLDSATVVGQMQGRFSVNSPRLRMWHQRATAARRRLKQVEIRYIPRAWNSVADGLARQARLPWGELRAYIDQHSEQEQRFEDDSI